MSNDRPAIIGLALLTQVLSGFLLIAQAIRVITQDEWNYIYRDFSTSPEYIFWILIGLLLFSLSIGLIEKNRLALNHSLVIHLFLVLYWIFRFQAWNTRYDNWRGFYILGVILSVITLLCLLLGRKFLFQKRQEKETIKSKDEIIQDMLENT